MTKMEERMQKKNMRENFMAQFNGDVVLSQTIPNVAKDLMYEEFGVVIDDSGLSVIPITFFEGWKEVLKYMQSITADEFSIDVGGISLEYVTDYSESDKCRNIVPQLIHKRAPDFRRENNVDVPSFQITDELLARYNRWRSVNLKEVVSKIEEDVRNTLLNEYGLDIAVSQAVLPMMSAAYAVGVQLARETHETINMYNVFEIDCDDDGKIILTPLAMIKQYLKNDTGKEYQV